ncbi:MAG: enoyl-CoA hydratase/isomerase family protein [Myxococcota bacterium]
MPRAHPMGHMVVVMVDEESRLLREKRNRVATLRMNHPRRLNGWTFPMQQGLKRALVEAAQDDQVGAVVLTGTGPYYSAGVDLGGAMRPMHPATLHATIEKANYELFDAFIQFPKPIIAAVNGHAIGAPVTTATLCDRIIAAEDASFRTPFARFGLPPEGCSSILFPRLLGERTAERVLGSEGWRPTAKEALDIGLVDEVVANGALLKRAQAQAEAWLSEGYTRAYKASATKEELMAVNRTESKGVADALLSSRFLMSQSRFLASKKKRGMALAFLGLRLTRPLWALLLDGPREAGRSTA